MKTLLLFGLLVGALACQPQTSPPATPAGSAPVPAKPPLALLQRVNLAPAWANRWGGRQPYPMEGFYGPDHYHISFFFEEVQRNPHRPAVFQVRGRTRYKKLITPFVGTITVARLTPLVDTVSMENGLGTRAYTAVGTFVLHGDPAVTGAGTYQGQALLDFCVNAQDEAVPATFMDMGGGAGNPTRGSGLLFAGTWRSQQTGAEKPVAWSSAYEVIVPEALQKMGLGQRGAEPDPKLAKYGWAEFLENDEWWNSAAKASVPL